MMRMGGYYPRMGLGKYGQGRTEPLEATVRLKNAGLGYVERFKKTHARAVQGEPAARDLSAGVNKGAAATVVEEGQRQENFGLDKDRVVDNAR
jgi:hypothetical protein